MKIYITVISWAGTLDDDVDNYFWDKDAAIRSAKEIITDDERNTDPDDYGIYCVYVYTMIPDDNGAFRTIDQYKVEHTKREDNEA